MRLAGAYIRTYRNVLNDDITRLGPAELAAKAQELGLARIQSHGEFDDFLEQGQFGNHLAFLGALKGLHPADTKLAIQLRDLRNVQGRPVPWDWTPAERHLLIPGDIPAGWVENAVRWG